MVMTSSRPRPCSRCLMVDAGTAQPLGTALMGRRLGKQDTARRQPPADLQPRRLVQFGALTAQVFLHDFGTPSLAYVVEAASQTHSQVRGPPPLPDFGTQNSSRIYLRTHAPAPTRCQRPPLSPPQQIEPPAVRAPASTSPRPAVPARLAAGWSRQGCFLQPQQIWRSSGALQEAWAKACIFTSFLGSSARPADHRRPRT